MNERTTFTLFVFFKADADAIKKICDIYDWDGKGQFDMFYLMDVVYAAGYNVTKKICMGLGQQEEEKKKFCSFDEVVALVNKAIATPECSGTYHDYVELCKLYDKNENGTMMLAELENILSNLGEKIGVKINVSANIQYLGS